MMTYDEARKYIGEVTKRGSILGLTSIKRLLQVLSLSEGYDVTSAVPVIHIAGTNGKGSVGAFLSMILQKEGLSVGRYTSPAVFDPLEVWTINGKSIEREAYANMVWQVKIACERLAEEDIFPTVFEVETAMAFLYFARERVDVLLLETGLGGTWDATNVVDAPLCEVITTISRDHMQFLGETLAEIAGEKAGIIKEKSFVFSASQEKEVKDVLREVASSKRAELSFVNPEDITFLSSKPGKLAFSYQGVDYETRLAGSYQMKNAALAILVSRFAVEKLCNRKLENGKAQAGIKDAFWPGRFQVLREEPLLILDGAHNEDAAIQLRNTLENCFTNQKITYIIGVLADKEHDKMLEIMLPLADCVYTVTPDNPRAMDGKALAEEARKYHDKVTYCKTIKEALHDTKDAKITLAFGSLSYLGALTRQVLYGSEED